MKLDGKTIRHRNNFDVCFHVFEDIVDILSQYKILQGYWINISDVSGTEQFPMVPERIRIREVDMINWFVYSNEVEAHMHSIELRKGKHVS